MLGVLPVSAQMVACLNFVAPCFGASKEMDYSQLIVYYDSHMENVQKTPIRYLTFEIKTWSVSYNHLRALE